MNVSSLFRTACQNIGSIIPRISSVEPVRNILSRKMHHMCNKSYFYDLSNTYTNKIGPVGLLQPVLPMYNLTCGLKMKTVLHRRCKYCILMWRNGRKYIKCKAMGRHNQVERKPKIYQIWKVTHATHGKPRDW